MRDIISSINNPVATAVGEASQVATAVHTSAGHSSRYVTLPDKGLQVKTVQPRSGVNFVLYNSAFEVVEENTGYLPVDDKINAIQTLSTDKMVMAEAGFIEVFVDNQSNTAVYYDNMMVVHSSGSSNVLEVNAYYPYGMLMPGLSLIAPPGKYNAYKHSAKELQKELGLSWYDHGARMYDPNDYFDIYTGEYLGEDQDPLNDNVYLTTKANWKAMKGESWSSKVVGSVSPDGHSISSEVATEIFNHYYTEAGYDLNELSGNSVVPQIEGNLVREWTDLGIAEYGSQFPGLNAGEFRISAEKHLIGGNLITKYDFINLFIHERGSHIKDFQNNEKTGLSPLYVESRDRELFERNAIRMQVTHPSWLGTSIVFKPIIRDYALSINALSASELDKYFPPNL